MTAPRTYRPPSGRPRSFSPAARSEPRSAAPPKEARRLWRAACDAAGWDAATPEHDAARMTAALRELGAVPFPLPAGDLRGAFAPGIVEAWRLYARATGAETRRRAAPLVSAGARMLLDLLIEQGAEQAAAARAATGQRDD